MRLALFGRIMGALFVRVAHSPPFSVHPVCLWVLSLGGGDRSAMAAQLAWWSLLFSRSRVYVDVSLLFMSLSVVFTFSFYLYLVCLWAFHFLY